MPNLYLALALILSLGGNALQWQMRATLKAEAETAVAQVAAADAVARADAERVAREIESARAVASAQAAEEYERGRQDAQISSDRVVADLRAGTLRVRREWAGCETARLSEAVAAASQPDAAAELRAASAGRIVRAAAQCDAQVASLQALVRADRWPVAQ